MHIVENKNIIITHFEPQMFHFFKKKEKNLFHFFPISDQFLQYNYFKLLVLITLCTEFLRNGDYGMELIDTGNFIIIVRRMN